MTSKHISICEKLNVINWVLTVVITSTNNTVGAYNIPIKCWKSAIVRPSHVRPISTLPAKDCPSKTIQIYCNEPNYFQCSILFAFLPT